MPHYKRDDCEQERIHLFVVREMLGKTTDLEARRTLINQFYRDGGGCRIDFTTYPEAREIYEQIEDLY